MKYKLIAIDLDDTLLGSDLKISSRNRKALMDAKAQGILITIATGRMFRSAVVFAEELGLDVPIITYQGGLVKNAFSGEILYNKTLSTEISHDIIKICNAKGLHLQIYIDNEYYIERANEYSHKYHRQVGVPGLVVGTLDKFLSEPPNKLLIIDKPDTILKLKDELFAGLGEEIEITTSKPEFLEFTHKDATKGKALEYLSQTRDIPKDNIMAIGDGFNDISMIEYAGLGIAMGNAPKEVRDCADYVTGTNNEDGVAHAIEKFILGRRC